MGRPDVQVNCGPFPATFSSDGLSGRCASILLLKTEFFPIMAERNQVARITCLLGVSVWRWGLLWPKKALASLVQAGWWFWICAEAPPNWSAEKKKKADIEKSCLSAWSIWQTLPRVRITQEIKFLLHVVVFVCELLEYRSDYSKCFWRFGDHP